MKISGLKELADALGEFKKSTERTVLRRVASKALEPMRDRAKSLAPVHEGKLRDSIVIGTNLNRNAKAQDKAEPRQGVRVFVGTNSRNATPREFGGMRDGKFIAPKPFMRPAWDATAPGMVEEVRKHLAPEIERTAARIAKRSK